MDLKLSDKARRALGPAFMAKGSVKFAGPSVAPAAPMAVALAALKAPVGPPAPVGTVTRVTATEWITRYSDGHIAGMTTSLRAGQVKIEQGFSNRFLQWVQERRIDGVEAYAAYQPGTLVP